MTAENNCLETLAQWRFWWLPQKHKEGKKILSSQTQSSWSGHIDKWWKQIQQYQIGQFYSVRKLFIKVLIFNRSLRWWGDTKETTIVCIKLQLFSYSVGYCTSHWHGTWTKTEFYSQPVRMSPLRSAPVLNFQLNHTFPNTLLLPWLCRYPRVTRFEFGQLRAKVK